jgi:hypothetical protein
MASSPKPVSVRTAAPPPSVRKALIAALVSYFLISHFVPFGHELLYPLTLLSTWVHEMGHGLTALAVGGRFQSLDIFGDASGLAHTASSAKWQQGLVAAGGLIAPPVAGAFLLAMSRGPRRARIFLAAMTFAILASLALWVRSAVGFVTLPLLGLLLVLFVSSKIGTPWRRMVFAQFLGVVLAIDTVTRVDYLFTPKVTIAGQAMPSDISAVANAFGGHYLVWGVLLAAFSFVLLALGLRSAWRAG